MNTLQPLDLCSLLRLSGRPALVVTLKDAGVQTLGARTQHANQLHKALNQGGLTACIAAARELPIMTLRNRGHSSDDGDDDAALPTGKHRLTGYDAQLWLESAAFFPDKVDEYDTLYRHLARSRPFMGGATFLPIAWNHIVETRSRNKGDHRLLQKLSSWLTTLNWERPHFTTMSKCSPVQVVLQLKAAKIDAPWLVGDTSTPSLHPNLTIFDTRLTNLDRLLAGSPPLPNVIAVPLLQPWASARCIGEPHRSLYFGGRCHGPDGAKHRKLLFKVARTLSNTVAVPCDHPQTYTDYRRDMCSAHAVLCPSGFAVSTFMVAEAVQSGRVPIFSYSSSRSRELGTTCHGCHSREMLLRGPHVERWLPFADEVPFSTYGVVLHATSRLLDALRNASALSRPAASVRAMHSHRGVWKYIAQRMTPLARRVRSSL